MLYGRDRERAEIWTLARIPLERDAGAAEVGVSAASA
jgi:hypothetical protein